MTTAYSLSLDTGQSGAAVLTCRTRRTPATGSGRWGRVTEMLRLDNGTEFVSNHFDAWAHERGILLDFIAPDKPMQNDVESFNGRFRDECLNAEWFSTLVQAKEQTAAWRIDYNRTRPRSALRNMAPEEY